jgi:murein DD-endopeptidase MepM/ murein hydrolase activator NlpD
MYKRTMTAIPLAMLAALAALPAQAKTEALLIGTSHSTVALAEIRANLKTGFGINTIQVATSSGSHDIAERVRDFLSVTGKPDDMRVIWITGGSPGDVCPSFDEAPVRPQSRSLVIAPTCVKLLVQAPTTYERLGAEGQDDRSGIDQRVPGVAFVSLSDDKPGKSADILVKVAKTLTQTLACSRSSQATLDFSPSVAAWGISIAGCQAEQAAVAPQPARPAEIAHVVPPPPLPEKAQEPQPQNDVVPRQPTSSIGVPANEFRLVAPVKGRIVSAYGNQAGGKASKGIDLEVPSGTVAKAAESGEVVFVGELPGYGQVVAIKHDNDWATVYARTVKPRVTQGQKVTKGQDLADVDPVANRLHFEVRRKGKAMDPEPLMAAAG